MSNSIKKAEDKILFQQANETFDSISQTINSKVNEEIAKFLFNWGWRRGYGAGYNQNRKDNGISTFYIFSISFVFGFLIALLLMGFIYES